MKAWEIGRRAEARAQDFLLAQGWQILARNWRRRGGELDLVARVGDVLVFVEVRSRGWGAWQEAIESIPSAKVRALRRTASVFLRENRSSLAWVDEIRFDLMLEDCGQKMEHVEGLLYTL